jgi:Tfp pilus assembly protein PilX
MFIANEKSSRSVKRSLAKSNESGAALATAILMMGLLSAIAMTVLAVVRTETRVAGSDLRRTQTFYAAAAGIEKMTNDFSGLYQETSRPTDVEVDAIKDLYPTELYAEGFSFYQTAVPDTITLAAMRSTQGIADPALPQVTMPGDSAFSGLIATVKPYTLTSTAVYDRDGTQVTLTRNMNNYMIPLFQFGMFSDEDIELHPGATFTFNGRVHANGNVYVAGLVKFLDKVTSAHEVLYDTMRNGEPRGTASVVSMAVGPSAINVPLTKGSMVGGPNISSQTSGQPNFFPGSPTGILNEPPPTGATSWSWETNSKRSALTGTDNQFGGQLLTRRTGASQLRLPMQLGNNPTREIIKRRLPNDSMPSPALPSPLSDSRYHTKAKIRILIDDEGVANDVAGLYGSQNGDGANTHNGVNLSTFDPMQLPNVATLTTITSNGGGRALWRVNTANTGIANSYNETATTWPNQLNNGTALQADTVRSSKAPVVKAITGVVTTTISGTNYLKITSNGHGYSNGDFVNISGVQGATNANGEFIVGNVTANTFTLNTPRPTSLPSSYTTNTGTVYELTRSANGAVIPYGAGLSGHILIQIVDSNDVWRDVTAEVLSMGMTVGEPNAIVQLQRPLWAAFTQGSRDGSTTSTTPNAALNTDPAYSNCLTDIINKTHIAADGEINTGSVALDDPDGYLTSILDDTAASAQPARQDVPPSLNISSFSSGMWNSIVPINLYNVREGRLTTSSSSPNLTSDANQVYERGITNIVELNMKNLARWVDGVYDQNLLAGTNAVSANIAKPDGYVIYVSDRRGDNVKTVFLRDPATGLPSTISSQSSNGMVDNVDIYGPNGIMDNGEDVQGTGAATGTSLTKDTAELPDPAVLAGTSNATDFTSRRNRALAVAAWTNPSGYFRGSVRLFNAEDLQAKGTANKLSNTLGITVSSENLIYTWGNYNTTGINVEPASGTSSYNDASKASHYMPTATDRQVPASIVSDAWFPLSKTWFDGLSSVYPDLVGSRPPDRVASGSLAVTDETSVRAGIIAGNNLGAMAGQPDAGNSTNGESRLNGGMHNFPRFLESWGTRFNFVGALIPLYRSTQALGPYNANSSIYGAPVRNWAFDTTFRDPNKLPPGTPQFQHIEPTGFRQVL